MAPARQTYRCKDFVRRIRPSPIQDAPDRRACKEASSYLLPKRRKERLLRCARPSSRYHARPRSGEAPFGMTGKGRAPLIAESKFASTKGLSLSAANTLQTQGTFLRTTF